MSRLIARGETACPNSPEDASVRVRWLQRAMALVLAAVTLAAPAGELAIVIDDVGYNRSRGLQAAALPAPVTLAILPLAPHARFIANQASAAGQDVIVHQPMQPAPGRDTRMEKDTLMLDMEAARFDELVNKALNALPQRVGVSNHTGSLLTQHAGPMRRPMDHLRRHDPYFLDSRTTPDTVALQVARDSGVAALKRDVFLDHDRDPDAIEAAFDRALSLARRNGAAVMIGHPYRATLAALERRLAELPEDIALVRAGQLARKRAKAGPAVLALPARPMPPHISLGR